MQYKTLILSLLFVMLAGCGELIGWTEARQTPWKHYLVIDEMTGRPTTGAVYGYVKIEGTPWLARLDVSCKRPSINFEVLDQENFDQGKDWPSWYSKIEFIKSVDADKPFEISFRVKFDNKEPSYIKFDHFSPVSSSLDASSPSNKTPEAERRFKESKRLINGIKKHERLWIEFFAFYAGTADISHVAKFDLTGFSREQAKCSRILDTN